MAQATDSLPMEFNHLFVEYRLMKELVLFQKRNISHVYISPSQSSAFDWFGVMFIHRGFYSGKMLRFMFLIDTSYPRCDIPKIVFDPIPVHPLVNKTTGELSTNWLADKWNSVNHLYEVIAYAKSVFEIDSLDDLGKLVKPDSIAGVSGEELVTAIKNRMIDFNAHSVSMRSGDRNFIDFSDPPNGTNLDRLRQIMIKDTVGLNQSLDSVGRSSTTNTAMSTSAGGTATSTTTTNPYKPLFTGFSWRKISLE